MPDACARGAACSMSIAIGSIVYREQKRAHHLHGPALNTGSKLGRPKCKMGAKADELPCIGKSG